MVFSGNTALMAGHLDEHRAIEEERGGEVVAL